MNLAIFDLDHTLIRCDSDYEWPQFLYHKGVIDDALLRRREDFYRDYLAGTLDIDAFLRFQLQPLSQHPRQLLDAWHREFMHKVIEPTITAAARQAVAHHQQQGDTLLLLSATNEFIITPIAHVFGIHHVIGVSLEVDEHGEYTGAYVGTPSFREGKITRLEAWLAQQQRTMADYEKVYFYSDSKNDLPLLEYVSHPVAVHPDEVLKMHAQARGWPVVYW